MTDAFRQALAALDGGDLAALRSLIVQHPEVVHEREDLHTGTYAGYFMHATLLHHAAGNPIRGPLPANIVEGARVLLDAGADARATCGDKHGGDVLGLVASGAQMAESGLYRQMIDLLLDRGVSMAEDRGVLSVCLYHTVECKKQREVGEYLAARGAKVDLVFAAALGRTDLVDGFFSPAGRLTDDAHGPFRPDADERRARGEQAVAQEALVWAAMNGRDTTIRQLVGRGVDVNGTADVAGGPIAPLHGAAWAGWPDTCAVLLDLGADHTQTEPRWGNTPISFAAYCRRPEAIAVFQRRCADRLSVDDTIAIGDLAAVEAAIAGMGPNDVPPGMKARPGVMLRDAAIYGRRDVVALLLSRGADRTLTNPEGKTALDFARERGFSDIVALLERDG